MLTAAQRSKIAEDGFCVIENAISPDTLARAQDALDRAIESGRGSADGRLDPNSQNIRVYNLPAIDPVFIELLNNAFALEAARAAIGPDVIVSNFTANVALPGSGSMNIQSDQALVMPGPWPHCFALNAIWCLDDVHEANGATRYLPGSHRYRSIEEVPADATEKTVAFEAPAGSFVAMEGRLWHTSGKNVTADERRRMLFAYYSADFLRQQMNWAYTLPQDVVAQMDDGTRKLFGLEAAGNVRIGGAMTLLRS